MFRRFKARRKKEIVTIGMSNVDPRQRGHLCGSQDWNALVDDPDTLVIDTRNSYETATAASMAPSPAPKASVNSPSGGTNAAATDGTTGLQTHRHVLHRRHPL